ncbi:MAG: hypothetical protein ABII75_05290 [Candidatus Omnitrophota bacterium]
MKFPSAKYKKFLFRILALFMIYSFFTVNAVRAEDKNSAVYSYLSPAVKIENISFAKDFQHILLIEKNISFDKLTPLSFYPQLRQAITQLLQDIDVEQLENIRVRFAASNDEWVNHIVTEERKKWTKEGKELNLEGLQALITDDTGGKVYRHLFYGLKTEKTKREKLIKELCKIFGKKISYFKDMIDKKLWANLWAMYNQYWAERQFRDRLGGEYSDAEWVDFEVVVKLRNATLHKLVKLAKKERQFKAVFLPSEEKAAQVSTHKIFENGGQRKRTILKDIPESPQRQNINTVESQREDYKTVAFNIERLVKVRDVYLAGWKKGVSERNLRDARNALESVYAWTGRGHKDEKKNAAGHLLHILKKDGYFVRKNYKKTIAQINEAIFELNRRLRELASRIETGNKTVKRYLPLAPDYIQLEILKNELIGVEHAIRFGNFNLALERFNNIQSGMASIQKDTKDYRDLQNLTSHLQKILTVKAEHENCNAALALIDEVDKRIARQSENLAIIKDWLIDKYRLTKFAQKILAIITDFGNIRKPGKKYTERISSALEVINGIIQSCNKSEELSGIKHIIIIRLAGVQQELGRVRIRAEERNEAIKRVLPDEKIVSVPDTVLQLKGRRKQAIEGTSYKVEYLELAILDEINLLHEDFTRIQFEEKITGSSLTAIGSVIPGILGGISKGAGQAISLHALVEQAI